MGNLKDFISKTTEDLGDRIDEATHRLTAASGVPELADVEISTEHLPPSEAKVEFVNAVEWALTYGPHAPSDDWSVSHGETYGHDCSIDDDDARLIALSAWYARHDVTHPSHMLVREARQFPQLARGVGSILSEPETIWTDMLRTRILGALGADRGDGSMFSNSHARERDLLVTNSPAIALYVADEHGGSLLAVDLDTYEGPAAYGSYKVDAHTHVYNLLDDGRVFDLVRSEIPMWDPTGAPYPVARRNLLGDNDIADAYRKIRSRY